MTDVIETQEEQNLARLEAENLANALYRRHYQSEPDDVGFELCDTTAGILSQIDNMTAGLSSELERLQARHNRLQEEAIHLRNVEVLLIDQTRSLADELMAMINRANAEMKSKVTSQDLDPPDYFDAESVHDAYNTINKLLRTRINLNGRPETPQAADPAPLNLLHAKRTRAIRDQITWWEDSLAEREAANALDLARYRATGNSTLEFLHKQLRCPHDDVAILADANENEINVRCRQCKAGFKEHGIHNQKVDETEG